MIVEYIRYDIEPERAESFTAGYSAAVLVLDADPHCLDYEVAQCVEDPRRWTVRIEWDSQQGHEQGFRKSPHFRTFLAAVQPFVGDIDEMHHYRVHSLA